MKSKLTLLVLVLIGFVSRAQSIEKFSIDSGGASASAGNIQILYTIGEVNVAERTSATISVSEGFISASLKIKISPQALLQGPILLPATPGLMNDILREDNWLPTISPYTDGATANASVFTVTGANAIVDWVWVELRSDLDTGDVVNGRSALIQRDGDIVATDGVSDLSMPVAPKSYYVVIKHRNHLGVMSANPIALTETTTTVDFTDSAFTTFGSNAQVTLGSGETALWTGDTNTNDQVKFVGANNDTDVIKDFILADPGNILNFLTYSSTGYLDVDVDMNGVSKFIGAGDDSSIIKDNVLAHPGNILNFITYSFSSTVPPEN